MRAEPHLNKISAGLHFVVDNLWVQFVYSSSFFLLVGAVSIAFPEVRPIVVTAALVLPFYFVAYVSSRFSEKDYEEFSPIVENLANVRFLLPLLLFTAIPVSYLAFDVGFGWSQFGTISFLMVASSVAVFVWSEGLYVKNYFFDRWHPVERGALLAAGVLTVLLGPAFAPLFLLFHLVITNQFNYPDVGGFMGTHSRLPWTVLLIASSWAVTNPFLDFSPYHVLFLFFCGYAAHYFQPGVAKLLENGPIYYIRENNPVFLFLNSYSVGWMNFIDEETVLRIGQLSQIVRPLLNISVVFIEMGTILFLISPPAAITVVSLTIVLHLLILASSGVNFWKWVIVDFSILLGLIMITSRGVPIFGDTGWIAFFVIFVVFARGWMNPVGMGWLDSPYVEYYRFITNSPEDETVKIHPNSLRPYDPILAQGTGGTFTFLGENPRIQFCLGAITNDDKKELHQDLANAPNEDPPDADAARDLVKDYGEVLYDEGQTEEMKRLIRRFLENRDSRQFSHIFSYLACPREFYTDGFLVDQGNPEPSAIDNIQIRRIDGIWSNDGFCILNSEEVLNVNN